MTYHKNISINIVSIRITVVLLHLNSCMLQIIQLLQFQIVETLQRIQNSVESIVYVLPD